LSKFEFGIAVPWRFHLQREHQRHHQALYQDGVPLLKTVIQACCSNTLRQTAMLV
jgi:hypothetical protein